MGAVQSVTSEMLAALDGKRHAVVPVSDADFEITHAAPYLSTVRHKTTGMAINCSIGQERNAMLLIADAMRG